MTPVREGSNDPLDDFDRRTITIEGVAKTTYVGGAGPAVIVMAEMPGISPHVARFARWVRDAGFTVFLPSLFGVDGAYPTAAEGRAILERACVSAEFHAFAGTGASPSPDGCGHSHGRHTRNAVGPAWEQSGCASPATLRSS